MKARFIPKEFSNNLTNLLETNPSVETVLFHDLLSTTVRNEALKFLNFFFVPEEMVKDEPNLPNLDRLIDLALNPLAEVQNPPDTDNKIKQINRNASNVLASPGKKFRDLSVRDKKKRVFRKLRGFIFDDNINKDIMFAGHFQRIFENFLRAYDQEFLPKSQENGYDDDFTLEKLVDFLIDNIEITPYKELLSHLVSEFSKSFGDDLSAVFLKILKKISQLVLAIDYAYQIDKKMKSDVVQKEEFINEAIFKEQFKAIKDIQPRNLEGEAILMPHFTGVEMDLIPIAKDRSHLRVKKLKELRKTQTPRNINNSIISVNPQQHTAKDDMEVNKSDPFVKREEHEKLVDFDVLDYFPEGLSFLQKKSKRKSNSSISLLEFESGDVEKSEKRRQKKDKDEKYKEEKSKGEKLIEEKSKEEKTKKEKSKKEKQKEEKSKEEKREKTKKHKSKEDKAKSKDDKTKDDKKNDNENGKEQKSKSKSKEEQTRKKKSSIFDSKQIYPSLDKLRIWEMKSYMLIALVRSILSDDSEINEEFWDDSKLKLLLICGIYSNDQSRLSAEIFKVIQLILGEEKLSKSRKNLIYDFSQFIHFNPRNVTPKMISAFPIFWFCRNEQYGKIKKVNFKDYPGKESNYSGKVYHSPLEVMTPVFFTEPPLSDVFNQNFMKILTKMATRREEILKEDISNDDILHEMRELDKNYFYFMSNKFDLADSEPFKNLHVLTAIEKLLEKCPYDKFWQENDCSARAVTNGHIFEISKWTLKSKFLVLEKNKLSMDVFNLPPPKASPTTNYPQTTYDIDDFMRRFKGKLVNIDLGIKDQEKNMDFEEDEEDDNVIINDYL
ncbi:hypothetical protein TRFO_05788 [Tritrichomonas foetus]|uniref:Uncharacterized protein n=1 Tax=Tritrichomonas foetus TaxID=1144522 RepID=A0A1J4K3A8_9EUKA|nr:hypothetical protein TRFO_05788 [Tritrichomonas foetus]|eukprot:OHT05667.1 hypothetical protein TRFO_05788 [Tritrichomonas foetus]